MLSRYKFNQIKVKTNFFNSYPTSVYQRSEVIECLQSENQDRFGRDGMKYNHMNAVRRPSLNVIPSTHCTLEFLSDLVVDHFMLMTPIYQTVLSWQLVYRSIQKRRSFFPCI